VIHPQVQVEGFSPTRLNQFCFYSLLVIGDFTLKDKVLKTFGKTHYVSELGSSMKDQSVTLTGWVHRKREHGGVIFIIVRDSTGIVQVAGHRGQMPDVVFDAMQQVISELQRVLS
jgi:lysyl-tRNA synthetase class II